MADGRTSSGFRGPDFEDRPLRILHLEDSPEDRDLMAALLREQGLASEIRHVDSQTAFEAALDERFDLILADYSLPGFSAEAALAIVARRRIDIPFIVVSGSIGEETAVDVLRQGASDYLLKDRLGRLGQAITRAVNAHRMEREKRHAQEQMQFALEAARVGTWEIDIRSGVTTWSPILEALHGMLPGGFGGTFAAFLHCIDPADRDGAVHAIERATLLHTDSRILYRTRWADGSLHWIRGRGRTFYDAVGAPVRAAGVGYDVTDHQALEEQLRQSQKIEAVGQLAGGVAHDFNNLLTAILSYADFALDVLDPAHPVRPDIEEIRHASESAASLTRQLLAFSRRQILQPKALELNLIVTRTEALLRRVIGENIQLTCRLAPRLATIMADPGQIEQVIMNLCINARDAMPNGGRLTIETANVDLDDEYIRQHPEATAGSHALLAVTDTGVGMDDATQAHIFEPFFTTKSRGEGTGLGLATVYGIVKQSGASIRVESQLGRGATFKVYFPRTNRTQEQLSTVETPVVGRGTETILIAEDQRGVLAIASKTLRRHGYVVLSAGDGEEAVRLAREYPDPIHLVLTDIVMPGMGGRELVEHLRKTHPLIRVLYTSGYADDAVFRDRILEPGAAFLEKPFRPQALANKVREALDAVPLHVEPSFGHDQARNQ